jgi:hypothetical protein
MLLDNFTFVILDGPYKNLTLASIKFKKFGERTNYPIIECQTWAEGFVAAQDYQYAIFLSSGTVFTDLEEFLKILFSYPHQGLIGHITDPLSVTDAYFLHPQAFLLELDKFTATDFELGNIDMCSATRSEQNIHSNYTPLWLKPGTGQQHYNGKRFGERLIARHINSGHIVVNWNNKLRACKQHLRSQEQVDEFLAMQQDYFDVAENQLWVFNNEPFDLVTRSGHLVTPASGLYWILHLVATEVHTIDLVDISVPQLSLAQELKKNWNGTNYGKFIHEFMKQHNIKHYNLDRTDMTKLEYVQLMKPSVFIDTVNNIFDQQCGAHQIVNFPELWQRAKTKTVNFTQADMIDFLKTNTGPFDLWMSNITDYKYTMLKHTMDELNEYHTTNK